LPTIEYLSALAGAGKTHVIARQADKLARLGKKVIIVQPSKLLIGRTIAEEFTPLNPSYSIRAIHAETVGEGRVVSSIVDHLKNTPQDVGEVLLVTHSGFLRTPYWHRADLWVVIVDEVFNPVVVDTLQVPDSHALVSDHLDCEEIDAKYSRIVARNSADHASALARVSKNKHHDAVYDVFADFVRYATDDRYDLNVISSQYAALIDGREKEAQLVYFAELNPSIFKDFARVVVCSALMEYTLLYRLWAEAGVEWEPVGSDWRKTLRYEVHPNGKSISVYYASTESWSKRWRDHVVMDGDDATVMDVVLGAVKDLIGGSGSKTIWMGNVDTHDAIWAPTTDADGIVEDIGEFVRLPNSPHGLNSYQSYNNCVVTSALNASPTYFAWLRTRGIDGGEAKTAISRSAVYQAAMRSSVRDPHNSSHKKIVVMDRDTAEWLANDIFPGAKALPIPGLGLPSKGRPGRPRKYTTNRQTAYRQMAREQLLADLVSISGDDLCDISDPISGPNLPLIKKGSDTDNEVRKSPIKSISGDDLFDISDLISGSNLPLIKKGSDTDNEVRKSPIRSISGIRLPLFENKYADKAFHYVEINTGNDLIECLRELSSDLVWQNKEDSPLISAAHFVRNDFADTNRGLENIEYIYGIWFDCDGGDLSPEKFASLFPYLRMAMYSTFTSTEAKPKWRCVIPTSHSMTIRIHQIITQQMILVINEAGYWSEDQLNKNDKIKSRLTHGFDASKFVASSMFYLPSRPSTGEPMFWDFDDARRGPLNVPRWIESNILDLRPEPVLEPIVDTSMDHMSPGMKKLALALRNRESIAQQGVNQRSCDLAMDEWHASSRGQGNTAFFKLGSRLQDAGMELDEIERTLRVEYPNSGSSKADRRNQIKSIIRSLSRRGSTRQQHGNIR
jgi:hypothetical protein